MKGEESPPRQQPLVSIRLGSWSLLEEPHGGEAGSQSLLEETPQQGGGGRLGGGLISIRPGNSLHFKADLYIWGVG